MVPLDNTLAEDKKMDTNETPTAQPEYRVFASNPEMLQKFQELNPGISLEININHY